MNFRLFTTLSAFIFFTFYSCNNIEDSNVAIIPMPQSIAVNSGYLDLSKGFAIKANDSQLEALIPVIKQDYYLTIKKPWNESETNFELIIDENLKTEEYRIEVSNNISITGGSYGAVAMALNSIWQAVEGDKLPKMVISDSPNYNYRSIMLDVARAWHTPETIKTIIDLCRWYKINYLHLHLTDDSAFTFPSDAFPKLPTKNHSYTKAQLEELNQYAYDRGVVLVPEIDVPGHSSKFVKAMPEVFGIAETSKNPYTVNMGKEEVYDALRVIVKEVASIFTYSPYVHIGGDEAFFEGMEDDPDIIAYMRKHNLPDMHELFLHFLIRMNDFVKENNKQTIVWAGFGEKGGIKIPNDVIVLNWNHIYHHPKSLLRDKYPIINASFKPLYVVNNRKWEPQYIYKQWQPNRWEGWTNKGDFVGEELEDNNMVMGATLCAWEQHQINQMPRLRHRAASVAQHLWSKPTLSWEGFSIKQQAIDKKLEKIVHPFQVSIKGLTYPNLGEGNFYEHLWFSKELEINVASPFSELQIQFSTAENPETSDWKNYKSSIILKDSSPVLIRLVDSNNNQIGRQYFQKFFYKPLKISTKAMWKNLPIDSWEKHRFEDTLHVTLETPLKNQSIRYQLDGRKVDIESPLYTQPIKITETSHIRAQIFDENGKPIGDVLANSYYKIWKEPSLTTGKPVTTSNDHIQPNGGKPAVNGRITLWEMWGDHKSKENWVKVDLEREETIKRFKVYTFWDNWRYYQYTIEGSLNGEDWFEMVDNSKNTEISTPKGIEHKIEPTKVRYVKINMLFNSANPGLHLVEFGAFAY